MTKRIDRRGLLAGAAALASLPLTSAPAQTLPRGIVLIILDDLFSVDHHRNTFGVSIQTPNLDNLAKRGVSFSNAFCTTALCSPSRTSIFTGMNPFKTGVHYNYDTWETLIAPETTLFALFKRAGWRTYSIGKTFHTPTIATSPVAPYLDFAFTAQWSQRVDLADPVNVPVAINQIQDLPPEPYFMAIGITDPHVPLISAQRFRDMYPLSQIKVPLWTGDSPPNWALPWLGTDRYDTYKKNGKLDDYIQAYLANVSEMDYSLGRLINAIDATGRDPIIVITSDHGYSLGDHDHIGKFTLWDQAARAPLIIIDSQNPYRNARIGDTVSLLDIAPTILEYAGIPRPVDMDGYSLVKMVRDISLRRNLGAMTSMLGSVSLRTNGYRYTRYYDGEEEFFANASDPEDAMNLIAEPKWASTIARMRVRMSDMLSGWKSPSPRCSTIVSPPGQPPANLTVC